MKNTKFYEVCNVFNALEGTASRNEMTEILANFYKNLNKEESQILSYLILGRVAPSFVNSEFNYSEKSFLSLIKDILKTKDIQENMSKKRKELGDIGDTVEYISERLNFRTKKLSLLEIYEILWDLVNTTGTGSIDAKNKIIVDILKKISPLEAKYFSRIVCGSLRFGVSDKTLLDVFSFVVQQDKGMRDDIERAYGSYADIGYICSLTVKGSKDSVIKKLEQVKMQPGTPVIPRLVERVNSFEEVFERLGESILVQSKYDGLRCQIHKFKKGEYISKDSIWSKYLKVNGENSLFKVVEDDYTVKLFTRNLEDVTEMFPEIVEDAKKIQKDSLILDSEVLGWNVSDEKFLTFQETMQRRRKYDVKEMRNSIPVKAMVFDMLYLEGKDLSMMNTEKRVELLRDINTEGGIEVEDTKVANGLDELNKVFNDAVTLGHEGVIVKKKAGGYLPGTRNYEWIKLKKSMNKKLVDSIDLVLIGYNLGSGRRKDLGIGSVLGASYNPKEDVFEGICNVGTGFSDEQLKSIYSSLKGYVLEKKPKNVQVEDSLIPDVWVEPSIVFTVEADEVTKKKDSNIYSLRFPRLIEWGRDKGVTEVVSNEELGGMYGGRVMFSH